MRKRIFIPMSIDQTSTQRPGYFFSPLKSFILIGGFIPGVVWSMFLYSSSKSYVGLVVGIVTFLIVYIYVVRFLVFEERRLKKMLKSLEENKISRNEYFWGIDEIDEEGVIHYRYNVGKLKKAVIVKVVRGSRVGVPDEFEEKFKACNLKFVRGLLKQNFSFMKYTKLEKKQMPEGIKDYIKRLEGVKDEAQRAVMKLNIDTISNFIKDYKSVVVDYYVVYNTDLRLMKSFKNVVRDTMLSAYGNEVYFRGTKILSRDEVWDFLAEVLNVKALDKRGYYNIEDYKFEDFAQVFRLFDANGNEILIDIEKEVEEKSRSRISGTRRGKTIEELEEEMRKKGLIKDDNEEEEEEIIYVESEEDLKNLDIDEYEIVYVEEDEDKK